MITEISENTQNCKEYILDNSKPQQKNLKEIKIYSGLNENEAISTRSPKDDKEETLSFNNCSFFTN